MIFTLPFRRTFYTLLDLSDIQKHFDDYQKEYFRLLASQFPSLGLVLTQAAELFPDLLPKGPAPRVFRHRGRFLGDEEIRSLDKPELLPDGLWEFATGHHTKVNYESYDHASVQPIPDELEVQIQIYFDRIYSFLLNGGKEMTVRSELDRKSVV